MKAIRMIGSAYLGLMVLGPGVLPGQTTPERVESDGVSSTAIPAASGDRQTTNDSRLARLLKDASLPAGVGDVVKLTQAGTEVNVLMAHVRSSEHAYRLRAEDVVYLRNQHVPDLVISAMIERAAELRARRGTVPADVPPAITLVPTPSSVARPGPAPQVRTPESTLIVIGSSSLKRGLSYRNYYYSPWNHFSSSSYGSVVASFGHPGRYDRRPYACGGYDRRVCP